MAVFAVFEHPDQGPERAVFVKEGFAAAALIFTVPWALWHRMWIVAALLAAAFALLYLAVQVFALSGINAALLDLAVSLLFAFEARNLWAASLRRAGYREQALVMASSLEEAELKHAFETHKPRRQETSTVRMRADPADTLGLFGTA